MKRSRHQAADRSKVAKQVACAVVAGLAVLTVGVVKADVLYDRTDMTDNQTFTWSYNCSISLFNGGWDRQAADDFELDATYAITSAAADLKNIPPAAIPADGFLVEFFPNETSNCILGPPPCPTEIPFAQAFSANFTATPLPDDPNGNAVQRFTVDLTGSGITLGPGTWWVSIVAVDESQQPSSLVTWSVFLQEDLPGPAVHIRGGGEDHGNGYTNSGELLDWRPGCGGGCANPTGGDASIKIEGTLVEPCPWDCGDADGTVGIVDFLALLAQWGGTGPCDSDGSGVGITDFLALLANWGACP